MSAEPFAAGGIWPGAKKAPELHAPTARLTDQGDCGLVALHHVVAWCDAGAGEVARMPGQRVGASVRPRTHSHAGCAWRETFPLLWNPARSASVLHACQVVRSESPCTCKHCTRLRCILLHSTFRRACTSCCCCVLRLLHAFLHTPSACFHVCILSPATRAQSLSPGKPPFPCCAEPFAVQAGPA